MVMPKRMTLYQGSSDKPRSPSPLSSLSLFLFRVGCCALLVYYHAWSNAVAAWNYIWKGEPWTLIEELQTLQYPFPPALAITASVICSVASVSIILGFLTRLSALLVFAVLVFVIPVTISSGDPLRLELTLFYLLGFSLIIFQGGGAFGADSFFNTGRSS